MSSILVTGVAGFIGSHVAEALLARGERVIGLDNLNDYYSVALKRSNVELLKRFSSFAFLEGDILERGILSKIFAEHKVTSVAHLAARAGVRPSIEDPFVYEDANIRGTLNLLDQIRRHPVKNAVVSSSSSVYGSSLQIPFREDDSATDRPISPYAATKKACEVLCYTYHHLYGMNVTVVRPFTVYGPRGRPDMAPWLFLEAALKGSKIRRFGDGATRRDYTYISDFTEGFVAALDRPLGYEVINLGNSETVSLNELIATVEEVTGRRLEVEQVDPVPGDVPLTNADISKARKLLGYEPKVPLREGMERFYTWYKESIKA